MDFDNFTKRFRDVHSSRTGLVSSWHGEELLDGEVVDTFAVIFRTRGCAWGHRNGCTMCGYHTDTNPEITRSHLNAQMEEAIRRYDGERIVKIYTSGSFLDPGEIPLDLAKDILSSFDSELTVVESRPEFIKPDLLEELCDSVQLLQIAMGLESANDFVLEHSINKGFRYSDYLDAREIVFNAGAVLRTYLLLKPPFLTENEAIEDLIRSISEVDHPKNTISINPVNVQRHSPLELLWRRKLYRPPWLWSLIEVIERTDQDLIISRAGLGSKRGANNCSDCDKDIVKKLQEFNLSQDRSLFSDLPDCTCKSHWKTYKEMEPLTHFRGSLEILSDRYAGYI